MASGRSYLIWFSFADFVAVNSTGKALICSYQGVLRQICFT
jgi:hypothetical protein